MANSAGYLAHYRDLDLIAGYERPRSHYFVVGPGHLSFHNDYRAAWEYREALGGELYSLWGCAESLRQELPL